MERLLLSSPKSETKGAPNPQIFYQTTVDDRNPALRTLNYGNDGIFLIMGNAGLIYASLESKAQTKQHYYSANHQATEC